jgi:ribonuclease-3
VAQDDLQRATGYGFAEPTWLSQALTHRSAGPTNNERLEFLGDSILNFVIAEEVFRRRPDAPEGDLSRLRANLVNKQSLAEIARGIKLGDCIALGSGELKSGGHRRDSILADALEAVFGAIYLDGGFEPVQRVIVDLYRNRLADLPSAQELKDAKTRLQEHLQGRGHELPDYRVREVDGVSHDQSFEVACYVSAFDRSTSGRAGSRRKAEQKAAQAMLETLMRNTSHE